MICVPVFGFEWIPFRILSQRRFMCKGQPYWRTVQEVQYAKMPSKEVGV